MDDKLQKEKDKEFVLLAEIIGKTQQLKKLQKENKGLEKATKNIEKSRTWKYTKPLRKAITIRKRVLPNQSKKSLEEELIYTKKELAIQKEKVEQLQKQLDYKNVNYREEVKQAHEKGQLLTWLTKLIQTKKNYDQYYNETLKYAASLLKQEEDDRKQVVYSNILSGLKVEDIPEIITRAAESNENINLKNASSFRASITLRVRKKQLGSIMPEWILDKKRNAYTFIDALGVKRPKINAQTYSLEEIPEQNEIVIKPSEGAGSRGVYLVYDANTIQDVKRVQLLNSFQKLKENMKKDLESKAVLKDEWLVEQLILEDRQKKLPGRDLKFYCFYGKVGLILEIVRFPELKYCWWTAEGKRISTGKYDDELFHGQGASNEEIALASSISKEIPAPFIRIDFLRSEEGLVFGEFTPKPGNYDEFDKATDQWLGDYFLDAENRLMQDLLQGKQFAYFNRLLSDVKIHN
jgi:TupA-like ATPgrasp